MTHLIAPLAGAVVLLAGCSNPEAGSPPPEKIEIVSGDAQLRSAGRPVRQPLVVRVVDHRENPVAGVPVTFVALPGSSVSSAGAITDADGLATLTSWVLRADGVAGDTLAVSAPNLDPVRFTATSVFVDRITVGQHDSCGLTNIGLALCWGQNFSQQFGVADTGDQLRPVTVGGARRFKRFAISVHQSCGIGLDDLVYCAGFTSYSHPNDPAFREIGEGRSFREITLGWYGPRCGIGLDGNGYCWGPGMAGSVNGEFVVNPEEPVKFPVASGLPLRALSVQVTNSSYAEPYVQACGLDSDFKPNCYSLWTFWTGASGMPPADSTYAGIASTGVAACGLKAGMVWCFGRNLYGTLGIPDYQSTFAAIDVPYTTALSAAEYRVCALTIAGVYCWGPEGPAQISGTESRHFTSLSISDSHACALTAEGEAWCWGDNQHGALGTGTRDNSAVPVQVDIDF